MYAHPLSLHLPSPVKLHCTLQLSGQIHWPCFISSKNMYSVIGSTDPDTDPKIRNKSFRFRILGHCFPGTWESRPALWECPDSGWDWESGSPRPLVTLAVFVSLFLLHGAAPPAYKQLPVGNTETKVQRKHFRDGFAPAHKSTNVPLVPKVCDVIFCMMKKHIIGAFSRGSRLICQFGGWFLYAEKTHNRRFLKGVSTFLTIWGLQ